MNIIFISMIILLTENAPIGMLAVSSMESVVVDFHPVGTYTDPLYEIEEYLNLCQNKPHCIRVQPSLTQSLPTRLGTVPNPTPNPGYDGGIISNRPRRQGRRGRQGRDRFPDWHKRRWVTICNNTPWSDMVLSNPEIQPDQSRHKRQQETFGIKKKIYNLCGWSPDAIINIYDKTPDKKWRLRVEALSKSDPTITIVSLNANDPKFNQNIIDTIHMLIDTTLSDESSDSDDESSMCFTMEGT
jgi:hypothetical protein